SSTRKVVLPRLGPALTPELTCLDVAQVFRPARGVANRAKALFHFTSTQLNHGVIVKHEGAGPFECSTRERCRPGARRGAGPLLRSARACRCRGGELSPCRM